MASGLCCPVLPTLTKRYLFLKYIFSVPYCDIMQNIYFGSQNNCVWMTSIYQPTNVHIISHKTLRHVSILSDHHQGAFFLAKVILQYSQFNSYLQTRCCGSISCCVGMCCGAVTRYASYDAHLVTAPQHNMMCCHNTSFANTNWIVNTVI